MRVIPTFWLCRVQLRVAQQTLVCRSLDRTGAALTLDGATFSSETTLNNGTNTIPFRARYFATGAATPGAANADATFKVQYQ